MEAVGNVIGCILGGAIVLIVLLSMINMVARCINQDWDFLEKFQIWLQERGCRRYPKTSSSDLSFGSGGAEAVPDGTPASSPEGG